MSYICIYINLFLTCQVCWPNLLCLFLSNFTLFQFLLQHGQRKFWGTDIRLKCSRGKEEGIRMHRRSWACLSKSKQVFLHDNPWKVNQQILSIQLTKVVAATLVSHGRKGEWNNMSSIEKSIERVNEIICPLSEKSKWVYSNFLAWFLTL